MVFIRPVETTLLLGGSGSGGGGISPYQNINNNTSGTNTSNIYNTSFTDKAGNHYFTLQQSKKNNNVIKSLFSTLYTSATSSTQTMSSASSNNIKSNSSIPSAAFLKSISDYEFRIILKCPSRKSDFVVAVDDTFEKIHSDWNWVERNLFLKVWFKILILITQYSMNYLYALFGIIIYCIYCFSLKHYLLLYLFFFFFFFF